MVKPTRAPSPTRARRTVDRSTLSFDMLCRTKKEPPTSPSTDAAITNSQPACAVVAAKNSNPDTRTMLIVRLLIRLFTTAPPWS
jgi:hypothetical protein